MIVVRGSMLSHALKHITADNRVVNVAGHFAAPEKRKDGVGESSASGVKVHVGRKTQQALETYEHGSYTLTQHSGHWVPLCLEQ